jgi:FAD/FMN-containing dehydrogenase
VARSGGHQYSGLSSGGKDTILLSMERFKHLEIKTGGGKTVARVGAGMLLTDVAAEFKRHGSPSRMESVPTSPSADMHSREDMAT